MQFLVLFFSRKIGILGFAAKTNVDMQQNSGGGVGLLAVKMAKYTIWYRSHVIMTL